jgi:hypothetical protein
VTQRRWWAWFSTVVAKNSMAGENATSSVTASALAASPDRERSSANRKAPAAAAHAAEKTAAAVCSAMPREESARTIGASTGR